MPDRDYETPLILGCLFPTVQSDAVKAKPVQGPKPKGRTSLLRQLKSKLLHWTRPHLQR